MFDITVEKTYHIGSQRVADLLVTAFEGGSNYWISHASPEFAYNLADLDTNWYATASFLNRGDWRIRITEDEGDEHFVTKHNLAKGFELLAQDNIQILDSIVDENYDASDADIWLQLAIFGGIVYG